MTIGVAIFLIAVGAILKWAVTAHVSGIDIQTAGTIIFVVGLVGLVIAVAYTFWWEPHNRNPRYPPPGGPRNPPPGGPY
ncbi:MAG: hypothetical protein JO304_10155 [Solirubrobacterales bacterium]|nr:hypothetical protein [Solirubrobacterales bacterium]